MNKLIFCCALLISVSFCSSAWASSTTYYAKLTVGISDNSPTAAGTVYAATSKSATSGSASAVGSGSSKESSASVTVYGFAKANDYYDFKGWSTGADGANPSGSSPYTYTVTSSDTSSNPSTGMTIYAVFAKHEYTPFDITFTSSGSGSYTVNDAAPANMTGLKYATKISLSSDDSSFFKWNINGQSIDSRSYELTCTAATSVEAVFITADQVKTVTTKDELSAALQDTKLLKVEIPASASILIPAGETLTVPEGLTLVLDGRLLVRGTLVNNGTISGSGRYAQSFIEISQGERSVPANSFASYPNFAYHKTTIGAATSGTVSGTGTISCTKLGCVVALAGTDAWADSTAASPAAAVCTVNNAAALNKITAVDSVHDTVAKAINAAYPNQRATAPAANKFVVLFAAGTIKLADLKALNTLWESKSGQIGGGFRIDCANQSLTISSTTDSASIYIVNGTTVSYSGSYYNSWGKVYAVGCSGKVSVKINANSGATSRVEFYDCASFGPSNDGSGKLLDENKGGGHYIYTTTGACALPSTTTNVRTIGGSFTTDPTKLCAVGYKGLYNEGTKSYDVVVKTVDYNFYIGDESVAANQFDTLADAIKAANGQVIKLAQATGIASDMTVGSAAVLDLNGFTLSGPGKVTISSAGDLTIIDTSVGAIGKFAPAVNVSGKLTVAYGTYSGALTLKSDSTTTTYNGTFTGAVTVNTGATTAFRGGKFATSVGNYLGADYQEIKSGSYYCVGRKLVGSLTKQGGTSDLDEQFDMVAIADSSLVSAYNSKPTFSASNPSAYFAHAEADAAITPYSGQYVEVLVSCDRDIAENTLGFSYSFISELLPAAIKVGEEYRAFYHIMIDFTGALESVKLSRYLTELKNKQTIGFYNSSKATANVGAICTIELCLYTGSRTVSLAKTRVTLGARNNAAYIERNGTPIFYSTLANAINAAQVGETVVLARESAASVTVSKEITIDTKGFAIGPVTAGAGYLVTREGDILKVTRSSGLILLFR